MTSEPIILDASALLALILKEKGMEAVEQALKRGNVRMTTVNIAEVATKLLQEGYKYDEVSTLLPAMPVTPIDVDETLAYKAASYDAATRKFGLSLGDRICLAAASRSGYTALTADQAWKKLKLDNVTVRVIR